MNRLNYRRLARLMCFTGFKPVGNAGLPAISRFCFCLFLLCVATLAYADIPSQMPLSLTTAGQPNLLVILDNSNSMDEDPTGIAQGSNCPASKSSIARLVINEIISSYTNDINMGLMTYQLANVLYPQFIYNTAYDVSYNPTNYNPAFIPPAPGLNAPTTKSNKIPNPTSPGNFIYYNVAEPFYWFSKSTYKFCYSQTANAFNNGEDTPSSLNYMLWDCYRCFNSKTGSSDTMPIWAVPWPQYSSISNSYTNSSNINNASATSSEQTQGYSGSLQDYFSGYVISFIPTDSDFALGLSDFGKQLYFSFVGSAYYSDVSPGRGFLNVPINPLTTAQSNAIQTLLACNVPNGNISGTTYTPATCALSTPPGTSGTCTTSGIQNAGNTPTAGTLLTAQDYFNGVLSNPLQAFAGYSASGYPLPQSCNKNFVILVTDGMPDTDKNGVTPSPTALADSAAAASSLLANGVKTYVVGFGSETQATQLNTIAAAGGSGLAYSASDYPTLAAALEAIVQDILSSSNSAASVAANSAQLNTGTAVYQATFNATDWSGHLSAYSVNTSTGALITPPLWEASSLLPAAAARNIVTYNPDASSGSQGISFLWNNLGKDTDSPAPLPFSQQHYLNTLSGYNDGNGALRVNWLRGDQSQEQIAGGIFRNRTDLLGDIINSSPVYVGSQDYGYSVLSSIGGTYGTFVTTTKTSRHAMLYAGANDGMLHGFDATSGTEVFAYLPNALFPKLSALTSPSYVHQYYVDGVSGVGDVYDGTNWHTLLAGVTGAGGRAVFALDVTDPVTSFSGTNVLWEFSNANDVDLGYTLAQPSVVRLQDGTWAVIVANGYDSDNGHAVLFVLNAQTGAVLQKISTVDASGLGTANGLSSPVAVDTNNDLMVDTVYAGDLHGNLWKFDVSGTVGSYPTPSGPLFVACTAAPCTAANRQPITGKPNVGAVGAAGTDQNNAGFMVYFGTGQYFATGDNSVGANPQVQTFYGLWDNGTAITDRASLQMQTITYEGTATTVGGTATTNPIVVVSQNSLCYAATSTGCSASSVKKGWALDLLSSAGVAQGERVVSFPIVRQGFVLFSTLIPNPNQCSFGGTSHFFEVSALSGGAATTAPFGTNGNGVVDNNDLVTVTIGGVSSTVAASGIDLGIGIINTPAVIEASTVGYKYFSGSTGNTATVTNRGGGGSASGRQSWRQLQ